MKRMHNKSMGRNAFLILLFVLGMASIMSQVLILREFLFAFGGNELIIGIFLSIWMLITGAGSFAGRFIAANPARLSGILYGVLAVGCLPVLLLFLIDFLRNILFLPGTQPGMFQIVISTIVLLSLYCFISGFVFSQLAIFLKNVRNNNSFDKAYAAESIGSMSGGMLFSFFLAYFLDNFETTCVVGAITVITVFFSAGKRIPAGMKALIITVLISVLVYFFFLNGSRVARHYLFPAQEIIETRDTRYGNLTVTSMADQLNFYQNNTLLFTTDNRMENEEAVHYAMVQHDKPEQVLLISGGIAGITGEILKYESIKRIDYLEIDPEIFQIGKELTEALESDRVITYSQDARRFIRKTANQYDVVIMSLPEPSTLELNRYYTREFISTIKKKLSPDGIVTFSLPAVANYLNDPAVRLNSSVYNTFMEAFQEVKIYPAGRNIYVASDDSLSFHIGQLIENKEIETDYVNYYYIDERSMIQRAEYILGELAADEKINTDFRPVAIYGFIQFWLSQFKFSGTGYTITMMILFLIIICAFFFIKPVYPGMFTAGFTASSFQVLLLISFQIVVGHVYQSLGVFVAVFMAGLGFGALIRNKLIPQSNLKNYALLQSIMAIISCLVPAIILLSSLLSPVPVIVHLLFLIMILGVSICTGLIFSVSLQLTGPADKTSIAVIYGTDMAGAALGAFITTIYIIPLAGILNAAFLYAFLNLVFAFNSFFKRKIVV
ncbi:MAG: fused MFS/spermidine synthase [Bacteroidales bacterium]|nr:fused MFS/spermidine synthase [Bacteroidales bacterium]